jgi:hypothetical protein
VTAAGIERHRLELDRSEKGGPGSDSSKYTPIGGRIYAYCPKLGGSFMQDGHLVGKDMDDGLCWWAGDHFEKATEEEKRRLNGISRLTSTDFENNEQGWSRRGFGAGPGSPPFTINVDSKFQISATNVGRGTDAGSVSIDLLRPGKAPERIGTFEARRRWVSKGEYRHAFLDGK